VIESLYSFADFDEFEATANETSGTAELCVVAARPCQRTKHFDEAKETEVVLHGRDKFRVESFLVLLTSCCLY